MTNLDQRELTAATGETFPATGFGTYPLTGANAVVTIGSAIEAGYRLLDSAVNYENEGAVGRAVRDAAVDREELIVTSKLPGRHHAYDQALATIQESVYRTGLDYLDLYLIHWPNPEVGAYVEAWRALVEAQQRGLVRAIGVSNFLPEHLDRIVAETSVAPAINQIEISPYFPQVDLVDELQRRGIVVQAWSPLGRGNELLSDPVITALAQERELSPGELVLAWHAARGTLPLVKSANGERQRSNLAAVNLTIDDTAIAALTGLGRPDGRLADQNPATHQEF